MGCLCVEILSLPCFLFWYCSTSCFFFSITFWSALFCHTVLYLVLLVPSLVHCPQLRRENMPLYWQFSVWLCPRHFFCRGSFRNRNTELKVQEDEYSTSKYRHAGRQKHVDFFYDGKQYESAHPPRGRKWGCYKSLVTTHLLTPVPAANFWLFDKESLTIINMALSPGHYLLPAR